MATAIICIALAIFVILSIRSYVAKVQHGCCGGDAGPAKIKVKDRNKAHYLYKTVLYVEGMSCRNCAIRVENALNQMPGTWATVELEKKQAQVRTKQPPDTAEMCMVVSNAGYRAGWTGEAERPA